MRLILEAPQLIDGSGNPPLKDAAVLVEGGAITAVGSQEALSQEKTPDCEVISVEDGAIMPGFVEVHSHIHLSAGPHVYQEVTTESDETLIVRGVQAVRTALNSGVTTMRDLGSKNHVIFPIREAIEQGLIPGPKLLASGFPITTTGGHCNMFGREADTAADVVKAIRDQFKQGADCIKIMSTGGGLTPGTNMREAQYDAATLRAAIADAERLELRVAAHCHGTAGVKNCVEAGVHNLIHCTWLSENPDEIYDYDPRTADEIAEKGLYVDPTLALGHLNRMRRVPDPEVARMMRDPARRMEILRDMWDRGVKFVTGMDMGVPYARFDDFAYTPEVMVTGMGISPMDAIVCSTKTSAECLGIDDVTGTLEKGKTADILIINGDPLADIKALHSVNTIVKAGQIVKRENQLLS